MTIRVLLVDDSLTARQLLRYMIENTDDMEVVAEAVNGDQAVELTEKLKPDIIIMDINMPKMDGLEATSRIMTNTPTPIMVVSASVDVEETEVAFQALRLGALSVQPKPFAPRNNSESHQLAVFVNKVRAMSTVRVIHHRWNAAVPPAPSQRTTPRLDSPQQPPEIVAIISSTGGPAALNLILSNLPADFPLPVVIVQHIADDFLHSMVGWLGGVTPLPMQFAVMGETPQPGTIYVAPGGGHLIFDRQNKFAQDTQTGGRHIPSGDMLLSSVAKQFGSAAIGVILTGMGSDGARGMVDLFNAGAYTIAQNEATCAVFGMPQEAIKMGAARQVLALDDIAPALCQLSSES